MGFSLHLVEGKRKLTVSGAFSLIKTKIYCKLNLNSHTLFIAEVCAWFKFAASRCNGKL